MEGVAECDFQRLVIIVVCIYSGGSYLIVMKEKETSSCGSTVDVEVFSCDEPEPAPEVNYEVFVVVRKSPQTFISN